MKSNKKCTKGLTKEWGLKWKNNSWKIRIKWWNCEKNIKTLQKDPRIKNKNKNNKNQI